jgi:hypothetical protein
LALTESNLASIAYIEGDFRAAIEIYHRIINVFHSLSDKENEAFAHYYCGLALKALGETRRATESFIESLDLFGQLNDTVNAALVQNAVDKLDSN